MPHADPDRQTLVDIHALMRRVFLGPGSLGDELHHIYEEAIQAFDAGGDWAAIFDSYYSLLTDDAVISSVGGPDQASLDVSSKLHHEIRAAASAGDMAGAAILLDTLGKTPIYLMQAAPGDAEKARKLQQAMVRCRAQYNRCVGSGDPARQCLALWRACIARARKLYGGGEGEMGERPDDPDNEPQPTGDSEADAEALRVERARRRARRLEELAEDPDNDHRPTDESREEARVALELEEQGKLRRVRRPDASGSGDFVDESGPSGRQHWDRKKPWSRKNLIDELKRKGFLPPDVDENTIPEERLHGKHDKEELLEEIRRQRTRGRKVIIDTTQMSPQDVEDLKKAINDPANGLAGEVIYYP
jgi:hypothetical protein